MCSTDTSNSSTLLTNTNILYIYNHIKYHTLLSLHNNNTNINELYNNNIHIQSQYHIQELCISYITCIDQLKILLLVDKDNTTTNCSTIKV